MEKISSGNLYPFETRRPKQMKTFDFPQETISHTIRNPHSKALEPDCLRPWACDYDTVSETEMRFPRAERGVPFCCLENVFILSSTQRVLNVPRI